MDKILSENKVEVKLPEEHLKALRLLNEMAKRRQSYRESKGAFCAIFPEPLVSVGSDSKVSVTASKDERSEARSLVEEMMILAGEVVSDYAKKNSIPIPYRVQSKGNEVPEAEVSLGALKPAFFDVNPSKHYAMGLDAYCQVTSPIRRYPDMMVAHQIKAHLMKQELPFSSWDILQYKDIYELNAREIQTLQNNSQKYWILKHLMANADSQRIFSAQILPKFIVSSNTSLKANPSKLTNSDLIGKGEVVQVLLKEIAMRCFMKMTKDHVYGEHIRVRVEKIDCMKLEMELTEIMD